MHEMTRDHARFPRVYAELLQYGTARNPHGAKPYGIAAASGALVAATTLAILTATTTITVSWWSITIAAIGALVMPGIWLIRISPDYVQPASDRYADALLATANEPGAHPYGRCAGSRRHHLRQVRACTRIAMHKTDTSVPVFRPTPRSVR